MVSQASASETDESQMDSVEEDEEGNKSSPPETVIEPGSTLACSAATGLDGKLLVTSGKLRWVPLPHHLKLK